MQATIARTSVSFPQSLTSFVGREEEIREIAGLLANAQCRLLTLSGPGGIGKTRLAIQATAVAADEFAHDAIFVTLQSTPSWHALLPAIADAVGLVLSGQTTPARQLQSYLQHKEMLIVLDNFEHLLEGAGILSQLLQAAPSLKLLVTSREVLNLQEEWQYPVHGLPVPPHHLVPGWEQSGAVQMFADRARQVRPSFNLVAEAEGVLQICRLVGGAPLALELAASWTKALHCAAIAAEIQKNIAFLESNLRNVPKRHRSIRAVFDQAWQQLRPQEREVFKRLALFRGGFLLEAAQEVAGASLPVLSALVDKSLLHWAPAAGPRQSHGRYQMHELLRQYAESQLATAAEEVAQTAAQHCAYYCGFLQQRAEALSSIQQIEVVLEINAELENVRAAWAQAVHRGHLTYLNQAYYTFHSFCDFQGRFREVESALATAVARLQRMPAAHETHFLLAGLETFLGWARLRLGYLAEAQEAFAQGQMLYENLGIDPPPGFSRDPVSGLALAANIMGDYPAALAHCRQAQQLAESRHDVAGAQVVWYVRADVLLHLGRYEDAWQAAQHGFAACQATGNLWMLAYIHIVMGNIARAQGDYGQAAQQFQASYDLKDSMNDPEGMALAVNYLAQIAYLQQRYDDAWQLYRQNLAIYREIFDQGGLVRTIQGVGETAVAQGQWHMAISCYHEALQITANMRWEPLILSLLVSVAYLWHATGDTARSAELAAFVHQHPAAEQEIKERARTLLMLLRQRPSAPGANAVAIARQTLAELEMQPFSLPATSGQQLLDPLTTRELEVLHLIADGLSNRDIATSLVLSVGTIKSYTGAIYSKLGVSSRTQAVARAREIGLIP